MAATAKKTDPKLWDKVKDKATRSDKGGKSGQWSARKAQMATAEYKKRGGGYAGAKSDDNHLRQWTEEEWDTKSGRESGETGERYLPKAAREAVSGEDYARSTAKKRADMAKGRQHSAQPKDVARKTAAARRSRDRSGGKSGGKSGGTSETKAELMSRARAKGIKGRSRMSKPELARALGA